MQIKFLLWIRSQIVQLSMLSRIINHEFVLGFYPRPRVALRFLQDGTRGRT
jgi:hypothetical protein